jgi:hypothetical protein
MTFFIFGKLKIEATFFTKSLHTYYIATKINANRQRSNQKYPFGKKVS